MWSFCTQTVMSVKKFFTISHTFQVIIKTMTRFQQNPKFFSKKMTFQVKILEQKKCFVIDGAYQTECKHHLNNPRINFDLI